MDRTNDFADALFTKKKLAELKLRLDRVSQAWTVDSQGYGYWVGLALVSVWFFIIS